MYRMAIELRQLHAKPYMWKVYTFRSHLGDCFREKKDTPSTPQLIFENLCLYSYFFLTFLTPLIKLNNTYHKKNPLAWRISSCQIIKRAVKMLKDHLLGSLVTICKGRYSRAQVAQLAIHIKLICHAYLLVITSKGNKTLPTIKIH